MVPRKSKHSIGLSDVIMEIKDAYYIPYVSRERLIKRMNKIIYDKEYKNRNQSDVQGVRE